MTKLLSFIAVLFAAGFGGITSCGSDDAVGGKDGGAGGNTSHAALCASACDVAQTCQANADLQACREQCALELAGQGYLRPEIAAWFFEVLAAKGTDSDCAYSFGFLSWDAWRDSPDKIDDLPEQQTIVGCRDLMYQCFADTFTSDGHRSNCFMMHYRYRQSYREPVEACFQSPSCVGSGNLLECMKAAQPKCEPWLAGLNKEPALECD